MSEVEGLMGWCSPPDQFCNLCPVTYKTQFGVTRRCSCPNHPRETDGEDAA